jgi:hypothetical protein
MARFGFLSVGEGASCLSAATDEAKMGALRPHAPFGKIDDGMARFGFLRVGEGAIEESICRHRSIVRADCSSLAGKGAFLGEGAWALYTSASDQQARRGFLPADRASCSTCTIT